MDKILAKLNIIRQNPASFTIVEIHRSQRLHFLRKIRQTLKKRPFQRIFSHFAIFQNFGREFPKSRKKRSGTPFAHQNTPFSADNPANSQHFNPS